MMDTQANCLTLATSLALYGKSTTYGEITIRKLLFIMGINGVIGSLMPKRFKLMLGINVAVGFFMFLYDRYQPSLFFTRAFRRV